ncbi:tetratricopeptide repeat protein, partial [Streptomyces sp. SM11]|uniref:tetratricopeptide repeat protein n=1 Tax=Streptomyces sp. SM11 TaxID=565557 RepID=UPI0035BBCF12
AVALGGEVPHQAHLPALVGDTHADAALGELAGCGLLSPAGPRYRLAAGVLAQLTAAGYEDDAAVHARTAAQHYAWWTSHPSVTPRRAVTESDAIVASLARLVLGDAVGAASAAVLLARSASPAFAAGLGWGAWERALRIGQEAARIAGEVAEEAYFHHELGVLALCAGNPDRARTELETSIGMRGALADKSGAVAGRRALALVADRSGDFPPLGRTLSGDEVPVIRQDAPGTPPGGLPGAPLFVLHTAEEQPTVVSPLPPGPAARKGPGRAAVLGGARHNLAAAGAGALLIAVLGTVVTLGVTSGDGDEPGSRNVTTEQTATEDATDDGPPADEPDDGSAPTGETATGETPETPGASDSASPSTSGSPSPSASTSGGTPPGTDGPTDGGSSSPDEPTPTKTSPEPTASESEDEGESPSPTPSESDSDSPTPTPTPTPTDSITSSNSMEVSSSASGPVGSASAPESDAATADPAA